MNLLRPFPILVALAGFSAAQAEPASVVFTAMGCGPYTVEAEVALARFVRLENETGSSSFLIHCGDIVTGKNKDWPESQYAKVAGLLGNGNEIPTFIVPGDNEWNDQTDPDRHWAYWTKHFMSFDEKWEMPHGTTVARQKERPENFSFTLNGVLFIGINHVGGLVHDKAEWKRRHAENARWVTSRFRAHREHSRAAVIFAQASAEKEAPEFLKSFQDAAGEYKRPILYLHADGHKWYVKKGHWAPNITHVQLDVVNAVFPPVQVEVTTDAKKPFRFDRRLKDPEWRTQPEPQSDSKKAPTPKKKPSSKKKQKKGGR
ncbi:MAG: hypothetical protein OSB65_09095 [Roseibacillus sp.]|nr:hypothetical protein [Roseibacillus sp.]